MTTICGLQRLDRLEAEADVQRQLAGLAAYSNERSDFWVDGSVALGRRLRRTLPEDIFDTQPYASANGRYVVVADARLTERDDLVAQLGLGEAAREMSDAAIVAAAVETWGTGAPDRIYGPFALAAWDRQDRRLMLARDALGERPLFYHLGESLVAFASMPSGLLALPDVPRAVDDTSLEYFLALRNFDQQRSNFAGIQAVKPGHIVVIEDGRATVSRYWRPELKPLRLPNQEAYIDEMRRQLERAVAASLRGVGAEVGSHLSAGLDSTAVTTVAADLMRRRGGRVTAFTGVPRPNYTPLMPDEFWNDEGPLAAETAALHDNVAHVRIEDPGFSLLDADRIVTLYGAPIMNLCNIGWSEAIALDARRRGLKVVLTGSMGNASISESGAPVFSELMAQGRLLTWLKTARSTVRRGVMRWRGVLWNTVAPWASPTIWRLGERLRGAEEIEVKRLSPLKSDRLARVYDVLALPKAKEPWDDRQHTNQPAKSSVQQRIWDSLNNSGPPDKALLGLSGVDHRDPTADRRLFEFCLRIPAEVQFHDGVPKAVIKALLKGLASEAVIANKKGGYQGADWHLQLNGMREYILDQIERVEEVPALGNLVDTERLRQLAADWPEDWGSMEAMLNYRHLMFRTVSAAAFVRQTTGSNR